MIANKIKCLARCVVHLLTAALIMSCNHPTRNQSRGKLEQRSEKLEYIDEYIVTKLQNNPNNYQVEYKGQTPDSLVYWVLNIKEINKKDTLGSDHKSFEARIDNKSYEIKEILWFQ